MKNLAKFESYHSEKEEMIQHLCNCGYSRHELEDLHESELEDMCRETPTEMSEKKKWIQDAIKRPGALRKKMHKKKGEKISASEIEDEISNLRKKDKDKDKEGIQGLSKKDLQKYRQLNMAKTLRSMKEHQEHTNYMFFANLENIHRMCQEILAMNHDELDQILTDGHNWALDHVATSKDDIEEVYGFLKTHKADNTDGNKMMQERFRNIR